jgi:hypothetical protein
VIRLKSYLVFSEYRVLEERRTDYLKWMRDRKKELELSGTIFDVYEGSDQPGLIVETFETPDPSAAKEWLKVRRSPKGTEWYPLEQFLDGGREKIRLWMFEKVV